MSVIMEKDEDILAQNKNQITILRADRAVMARDFALAYKLYRKLLQDHPDDCDILSKLGAMYVRKGDDAQGAVVYQKILNIMPYMISALVALGGIYRRLERYHESLAVLERALAAGGNSADIYYNLGFTYKMMELYEEAAACFQTVIRANPHDVLAYNHLGRIHALKGNHEQAIVAYRQGLALDPNHPVIHYNLALSYEAAQNYTAARQEYETALKAKPGWSDALNGYAELLIMQDMFDQAYTTLKKAVSLQPDSSRSHSSLGRVYEARGEMDMAEASYKDALKSNPLYLNALEGLASVYSRSHRYGEAEGLLKKAENHYPNDVSVPIAYASVLLDEGKTESAAQQIGKVWKNNKDNVSVLDVLGQYYIATQNDAKAQSCYDRIELLNPHYHKYCEQAAHRLIQRGDYQQAEKYLEKYLANHPNDSNVMMVLAQSYEQNKQFKQALELYQRVADINTRSDITEKAMGRLSCINAEYSAENVDQKVHITSDLDLPIDETDSSFIVESDSNAGMLMEDVSMFDLSSLMESGGKIPSVAEVDDNIDAVMESDEEPFVAEFTDRDSPIDIDENFFEKGETEELPQLISEEDEIAPPVVEQLSVSDKKQDPILSHQSSSDIAEKENDSSILEEEMPSMSDLLVNQEVASEYEDLKSLFLYLRAICYSLPPLEKEMFLSSTVRVQLDYLIQKLAGRPGLLEIVNNLHTLGFCRGQDMSGSESLLTADSDTNVSDLFSYMRTLISALPDRHLVSALDRSTAAVQNDLNKVIF